MSLKELGEEICSERTLRDALNKGCPVRYGVLAALARKLRVPPAALVEKPSDRDRLQRTDKDAVINRFFATMFAGDADKAANEFAKDATLHLSGPHQWLRSLLGVPRTCEGQDQIRRGLRAICRLTKVVGAEEEQRQPLSDGRVLSEGWTRQRIVLNLKEVSYRYALFFDIAPGGIHGPDLQLMSWGDGSEVPTSGQNLVIAGIDNNGLLHIRTFDGAGVRTDTFETTNGSGALDLETTDASGAVLSDVPEASLPTAQSSAITTLKQQLPDLLRPHVLSSAQRDQILGEVTSIIGHASIQTLTMFFDTHAIAEAFGRTVHPPQVFS
jgi:ketosteroid isomerase-like protein